jgi:histidine triad (HIT) family protein
MSREDRTTVGTPAPPDTCFVCRKHRGEIAVPGGAVYQDDLLHVGHVQVRGGRATAYLGHLLVEPRRHVPGLADLTDQEAAALGTLVARVSRALLQRSRAEHVYAFVLGDAVPHLHVHVVPRYPGAPREFWGVCVDEWPAAPRGGPEAIEALCADLRVALVAEERRASRADDAGMTTTAASRPAFTWSPDASSPRPTGAHLILYVRDQERARSFYEAALGVAPRLHTPGMTEFAVPGGGVLGLMPEASIRRLLPTLPDPALGRSWPRAETYLQVASPSMYLARALEAGATELSSVRPRDWGDDVGYCLDPDGHVLAFSAPTPPPAEGPAVELRAFDAEHDLARVAAWLEEPDARRWWGDPIAALADLVEREPGTAAVVAWDGRPVGVLCWQVPTREELEDAGLADLPRDLVDVDVLIGETDARGHGVAPEALRQLCARLREQGVRLVGMGAAKANEPALVAYVEPYRDFEEDGEGYRYFTRALVEDA